MEDLFTVEDKFVIPCINDAQWHLLFSEYNECEQREFFVIDIYETFQATRSRLKEIENDAIRSSGSRQLAIRYVWRFSPPYACPSMEGCTNILSLIKLNFSNVFVVEIEAIM